MLSLSLSLSGPSAPKVGLSEWLPTKEISTPLKGHDDVAKGQRMAMARQRQVLFTGNLQTGTRSGRLASET